MKYILEEELNRSSDVSGSTKFKVNDDGTILLLPPGRTTLPDVKNLTRNEKQDEQGIEVTGEISSTSQGTTPEENIEVPVANKQNSSKSGIIIKDCFRNVGYEELAQVRKWIADFEKRGNA